MNGNQNDKEQLRLKEDMAALKEEKEELEHAIDALKM